MIATSTGPSLEMIAVLKGIALLVFLGIFLFVLFRLIFGRSQYYDDAARIPLDDQDIVTPRNSTPAHVTSAGDES